MQNNLCLSQVLHNFAGRMKQIRLLLAAIMLSLAAAVQADEYACLDIQHDGGTTTYEVSAVGWISFSAGNMVLHLQSGDEVELSLDQLYRLSFSPEGQATVNTMTDHSRATFSMEGGQLRISGCDGQRVTVFTAGGRAVFSETCNGEQTLVNLSGLRRGMYIVSVGRQARKVMAP